MSLNRRVGIIGAMEEEVAILLDEMAVTRELKKASMVYHEGVYRGKNIVVVTSGIGKVNAALCTQILIDSFDVSCIINIGIAGGLHDKVLPGDVVVADNLVQHDMDTTFFGADLGQIPRLETFDFKCEPTLTQLAVDSARKIDKINVYAGRIVSGDQFIHVAEMLKGLHDTFGAYACEMEGAAIGQACYLNDMPFVVIRSISDNSITGNHMDYETFADMAIEHSVFILKDMIESL